MDREFRVNLPKRFHLIALFVSAIVVQTLFLYFVLPQRLRVNDNENYWNFYKPVAESILAGNGFTDADGKVGLTYPPGYPMVLASIFRAADFVGLSRNAAIDVFDILITSLSCLVIFVTARDLYGERIGFLGWILWVTYLPNLWTIIRPNTETPFMLLLYCSLWIFLGLVKNVSRGRAVVVGLIIGVAALIRPIAVFLPVVLSADVIFFRTISRANRILTASLILAGFLISVAPWEGYAFVKSGKLILLSTNGPSSMADGLVFGLEQGPNGEQMWAPEPAIGLMERANARRNEMPTVGSILKFGWQEANQHPVALAEVLLIKLYRPWYAMATKRHQTALLFYQLVYLTAGVAGLVYFRRTNQRWTPSTIILLSVIGYFAMMAFTVLPILRYMVPPLAYVIVFVAIAVDGAAQQLLPRGQRPSYGDG